MASSCWTNPVAEPETAARWPAAPLLSDRPSKLLPPSNQILSQDPVVVVAKCSRELGLYSFNRVSANASASQSKPGPGSSTVQPRQVRNLTGEKR